MVSVHQAKRRRHSLLGTLCGSRLFCTKPEISVVFPVLVGSFVVILLTVCILESHSTTSQPSTSSGRRALRTDVASNARISAETSSKLAPTSPVTYQKGAHELPIPLPGHSPPNADASVLTCPYRSLQDLAPEERYPSANTLRHMVDPPPQSLAGSVDTLVCCATTAGPLSILVHSSWAMHGSQRFLDMVRSGYFSRRDLGVGDPKAVQAAGESDPTHDGNAAGKRHGGGVVPLMRCVEDYLCQFGLRGNASALYARKIPDDVPWLPQGRTQKDRRNSLGVKRFMKGYLAYAGSGPNSRGRQLFVSLADQSGLGSAPWEVPFAEAVGQHSYQTLANLYTGYGEDGPSQESLMTDRGVEEARSQFPKLDWISSCNVVDEDAAGVLQSDARAREE